MEITELMAPQVLSGRLALVTGAGQGNGKAIAKGLAKAGATVIVTDLNEANAKSAAAEINEAGGKAYAYKLDVTSRDACDALALTTASDVGNIDILINNAGIIIREGLDSPKVASNLQRTLDVNVMGTFHPTHAWLSALKETKGVIINVGSIASTTGIPNVVGYSPSKGAVKMLTQALAVELAKDGIRVNAIAPGVIETPMTSYTREAPERLDKFMLRTPMARVGQPEELVGPVVFLASSMATYVTGVTLPIDGGFLAS
ncbi:SDR family NAD(P)-dependent oxidoreductase [Variovorax sp. YR216]|uniref:SDR family NAD(P)-dependent oxidoreductase n=1 Tax=Variovorax sp. YR216 TaxID=1882828 RepID=UPI0008946B6B|nr:glucose 1-dehydrogenase [Variovorax sp. YR216]SEA86282.1 NAD(P)-dependent dehydrogenase, short-chain alcohol dehydrogenase family [Variovorax sp. YR216]